MRSISNKRSGFSFIELIIVVAIMALISSVVLFKQAKFSSDILITNMAYQVALAIRQTEVYGLSSKDRGTETGTSLTAFRAGYGVFFSPVLARGGESAKKESAFAMFTDTPIHSSITAGTDAEFNYTYQSDVDGLLDPYPVKLTQGQKIRSYCAHQIGGEWQCWTRANLESTPYVLTIAFVKPNPEAHITMGTASACTEDSYGCESFSYDEGVVFDKAKITLESALGDKCRTITVSYSGEISVDPIVQGDETGGCHIPIE